MTRGSLRVAGSKRFVEIFVTSLVQNIIMWERGTENIISLRQNIMFYEHTICEKIALFHRWVEDT